MIWTSTEAGSMFRRDRRECSSQRSLPSRRNNNEWGIGEMTADRIGVIGGGLGGLASACTLAARGHAVVLFEQSSRLGGKAAVLEAEGYRFDMGPTILTLPAVL